MRVVIDMQGLQSESRFRGIGRYTLSFVRAVVRNRGDVEVLLALNGLFPETIDAIRQAFSDILEPAAIRVWSSEGPTCERDGSNAERRENAELVREAFLASLRPDLIHVTSLFEGFVDDAVTSIGTLDAVSPVTVALYDLIPLTNAAQYLDPNPAYRAHYLRKVDWLRRANGLLAISQFSRLEGRDVLGMDDALFHDVSTAIESDFADTFVSADDVSSTLHAFGISGSFVLYTGGSDGRKNLHRLIEAFARVRDSVEEPYQLVLAGRMPDGDVAELRRHAAAHGVDTHALLFTGYVTDAQLVTLYRQCACFVFASWHEGFGLPALEAMACGAPVIGSATSSIVEVIDLEEAMFDPFDVGCIADRMRTVLVDPAFSARLRAHGLKQAGRFSWDRTAGRALAVWTDIVAARRQAAPAPTRATAKPSLAMVTPLPPARSGIADYSADLLPALREFYDVDVIVDQETVSTDVDGVTVRSLDWFRTHAGGYDRIVYQMGNSPFHRHVPDLMQAHPGTLVLHDFYLSSLFAWYEDSGTAPGAWSRALEAGHGLHAVALRQADPAAAKREYPCNYRVIADAVGVIVHSGYARGLLKHWYGQARDASIIPLLKKADHTDGKAQARKALGLSANGLVVCSFGFLDPSKLNHLLLDAWALSGFAKDAHCYLVFVGENHGGEYGASLRAQIAAMPSGPRVHVTGFVEASVYALYLQAADIAVQMRTGSRGETSAAVMDCLSRGVPLVVNANGSLAEVYTEGAVILEDDASAADLAQALLRLRSDDALRSAMAHGGRSAIERFHCPNACARQYHQAIEAAYECLPVSTQAQLYGRLRERTVGWTTARVETLAGHLGLSFPERGNAPRLLLDITATVSTDLHTGIERVARGVLAALTRQESRGLRIEPVYLDNTASGAPVYRHARAYSLHMQGAAPVIGLGDDIVDPRPDDVLLTLDISGATFVSAVRSGLLARYRMQGVRAYAMLFDLLPVRMPTVFPPGADHGHREWLESIATLDGAVCISAAVADDMRLWLEETGLDSAGRFDLQVCHLGADIGATAPTTGLPDDSHVLFDAMDARPTFLMVGSIEPRKGYMQAIEAFSRLWEDGVDANLVVVGREGWRGLKHQLRRDIPGTIQALRTHREAGHRLHWLSDASDEYLEAVYARSSCLLAASYGEGFGLPLIEAARHGVPLLARDIPVFREVAGHGAIYFQAETPAQLAAAVCNWLALRQRDQQPVSRGLTLTTWDQMAMNLKRLLGPASRE